MGMENYSRVNLYRGTYENIENIIFFVLQQQTNTIYNRIFMNF